VIKVTLEIRVKNHEEILKSHVGFFGSIVSRFIDVEERVDEAIRKEILVRMLPEVKKDLGLEGVEADVVIYSYIEKRR
jgi:hypothetical protein